MGRSEGTFCSGIEYVKAYCGLHLSTSPPMYVRRRSPLVKIQRAQVVKFRCAYTDRLPVGHPEPCGPRREADRQSGQWAAQGHPGSQQEDPDSPQCQGRPEHPRLEESIPQAHAPPPAGARRWSGCRCSACSLAAALKNWRSCGSTPPAISKSLPVVPARAFCLLQQGRGKRRSGGGKLLTTTAMPLLDVSEHDQAVGKQGCEQQGQVED